MTSQVAFLLSKKLPMRPNCHGRGPRPQTSSTWMDASLTGHHATAPTTAPSPLYVVVTQVLAGSELRLPSRAFLTQPGRRSGMASLTHTRASQKQAGHFRTMRHTISNNNGKSSWPKRPRFLRVADWSPMHRTAAKTNWSKLG